MDTSVLYETAKTTFNSTEMVYTTGSSYYTCKTIYMTHPDTENTTLPYYFPTFGKQNRK